jgi:hypothetical protein
MWLGEELVIVMDFEKRKRKRGAKIDQVYFTTDSGITKHATFFRKLRGEEMIILKRDLQLDKLLS